MQSAKKSKGRTGTRNTRSSAKTGDLFRFFNPSAAISPGARVTAPRDNPRGSPAEDLEQGLWTFQPEDTFTHPVTPDILEANSTDMSFVSPPAGSMAAEQEIRALLQALPTRSDIESLILKLEETHRRDFQEVRAEVSTLSDRVSSGEGSLTALERRVADLERDRDRQKETANALQLHLEEVEDRSRRNNLRIRGIPETVEAEALGDALLDVFREVLGDPEVTVEVDRAHRALGQRSADPDRPRDVVCRLLRYTQKERIIRGAWDRGETLLNGTPVKILPDLSRATLRRRAMLKPALDLARQREFTYRWGYPLAVTFKKDGAAFTVQSPADLPALFRFLDAEPIQIPDWLQILPRTTGRSGPATYRPGLENRQRGRGRRRQRDPSGEGQRE